ncbi:unannotated protein [freshwater metagenome]|uniref:Unannotated protein n=1 Tax=freshwater metagenome TaxID=449393 RepID=A0A6J6J610_9ZZZZ
MGNGEDAAKHRISVGGVFIIECTKNVVAHGGNDFAQVIAEIDDETVWPFALNSALESEGHVSPVASWPRGRVRADGKHRALLFLSNHSRRLRAPFHAHQA